MPKYRFYCHTCERCDTQFANISTTEIQCKVCEGKMSRQLPQTGGQAVTEIVDNYTGVKRDQNHDALKKERHDEHYWNVEVPRLIQTYSLQTCLEERWLVYNDKGELVINKPPSKR